MAKPKPANIRPPSAIVAEAEAERAAIAVKSLPHLEKIEALKTEKAEQIDYYGSLIDDIRKSKQLDVVAFKTWRDSVNELPEDERGEQIEAKVVELGL